MTSKPNKYFLLFLLWIALIHAAISGRVYATHNHVEDDFDTSVSGGWSTTQTAVDPQGGRYLGGFGGNESVQLVIMDALPGLNGLTGLIDETSRFVNLSFELVNPDVFAIYTVQANGETLLSEQGSFYLSTPTNTSFVLDGPSGPLDLVDMEIEFSQGDSVFGVGPWGLDNVVVDWGFPVPEPTTSALTLAATLFLVGRRRFC